MFDRQIVHLDLDSFFVSVERLKNSSLIGKPVIIGGTSDRGVVASCSYEARKFGVSSAMPARTARRLCPQAIFVRGNMEEYSRYSALVTEILAEKAPVLEKASIDEHYLDISGMDKFIGCLQWSHELRETIIRETGLPVSFGLSVNKTVAKVATGEAKPNGEKLVGSDLVRPFLNPLSISKIPGLGGKMYQQLRNMGVQQIRTLSQIDPQLMQQIFGQHGLSVWQKANGIDESPVVPYRERKSISTESTFDADTTDVAMIRDLLTAMVMEIAYKLRQERRLSACISVKLRYSDFETVSQQCSIPYTALDEPLIKQAHELFNRLYQKRKLIRLVGVRLSKLVSGYEQLDLYGTGTERYNLCQAMDRIRNRFGADAVTLASTL